MFPPSPSAIDVLCSPSYAGGGPLLPALQRWNATITPLQFASVGDLLGPSTFLQPQLTTIRLTLKDSTKEHNYVESLETLSQYMAWVSRHCPHLHTFTVNGVQLQPRCIQALSIPSLKSLEEVAFPETSLPWSIFLLLSQLPRLKSLDIKQVLVAAVPPALDGFSFPRLETIIFFTLSPRAASLIFSPGARIPSLKSFTVKMAGDFQHTLKSISSFQIHEFRYKAFGDMNYRDLEPLSSMSLLTVFEVNGGWGLRMSDEEMRHIIPHLPLLRSFSITNRIAKSTSIPTLLTIQYLVQYCADIHLIALTLDCTRVPTFLGDPTQPSSRGGRVLELRLDESPILDPPGVAEWIMLLTNDFAGVFLTWFKNGRHAMEWGKVFGALSASGRARILVT